MSSALQERVFGFVRDQLDMIGIAPTLPEIAAEVGVGQGSAEAAVASLVRQRRLVRTPGTVRNLRVAGQVDLRPVGTETLKAELARRGVTLDALSAPRPLAGGRPCAANGCQVHVRPGMLMCRDHWFKVRKPLRDAIMASWSVRDTESYQKAVEMARHELGGFSTVVERVE